MNNGFDMFLNNDEVLSRKIIKIFIIKCMFNLLNINIYISIYI